MAAAEDKREWFADKLAWRRFWQRMPAEHARNLAFDARHGVSTAAEVPLIEAGVPADRAAQGNGVYRPLWEREFHAVLRRFKLPLEDFTFIDLGSGKGKLLLLAADYPFARIVGVEYSPELHTIAQQNLRRYRSERQRCHTIETVLSDAATWPLPAGPVLCFIFNSFDAPTMRRVMRKLDAEAARLQPVYVAYVNVRRVAELGDAIAGLERLRVLVRTGTLLILGNRQHLRDTRR